MVSRNDDIDGATAAILKGYLAAREYDNHSLDDLIAMARQTAGAGSVKNVMIRPLAATRYWASAPRTRPAPGVAARATAFDRSSASSVSSESKTIG